MWSRVLLLFSLVTLVCGIARAQAPPNSFYEGKTDDELRALASNPKNDVLLRRGAATRLVISLADQGDFAGAEAAVSTFAKNIDATAAKHVKNERRRRTAHVMALASLGVALVGAALALAAKRRRERAIGALRAGAPVMTAYCAYAGLAGGVMASRFENGDPLPFLIFALLLLPLVMLLRAWGAVGSRAVAARVGRGAAAAAAALALAFLVVEQINPAFLEGFGL